MKTGLKTYLNLVLRLRRSSPPKRKFIIWSGARSGSTLLVSLLNSHPQIHCDGELFSDWFLFPKVFLKYRPLVSKADVYGFKLLTYHLKDVQKVRNPNLFVHELHELGYRLIYLYRRNILRQQISNLYAYLTNVYHRNAQSDSVNSPKVRIDFERLMLWIGEREKQLTLESKVLDSVPHLKLVYEDDLFDPNNHQKTVDQVSKYLEIARGCTPKTSLTRVTPRNLNDFIENCDELLEKISASQYRRFLSSI